MKVTKIASAMAACALAFTLAACGGASTYAQYTLEEISGIKVEAENAGTDQSAETEEALEVKDGDVIVISPSTEKGSFHLTITSDDGSTTVYDDNVEGKVLFSIPAKPGIYTVTTSGNNVTGWMTVSVHSQEELDAQDAALLETLEEIGVDVETAEDAAN